MPSHLSLYLFSLNCARLVQPPTALAAAFSSTFPAEPPALLLFSIQELAPLAESLLGGTRIIPYISTFTTAAIAATKEAYDHPYELVAFHNVGFTGLLVFARHPVSVSRIRYGGQGVGVWDMGNKGAVGVRLTVEGVKVTAVAAHLAPDEFQVERRDADWRNIVRGLVFYDDDDGEEREEERADVSGAREPPSRNLQLSGSNYRQIYAPDTHLFVFGDLNYRTSSTRPPPTAQFPPPTATPADFRELLGKDQLTERRKQGKTLQELEEDPVTFKPTYKYLLKNPDALSFRRFPSWTDRILYMPAPGVSTTNYGSIQDYNGSDHKPVFLHAIIDAGKGYGNAVTPPFELDKAWKSKRAAARRLEVTVGSLILLIGSPTSWAVITAILIGGFGAWWAFRALYPL